MFDQDLHPESPLSAPVQDLILRNQARLASREEMEKEITCLAGQINAINYQFIKLLGEFDQQDGWKVPGIKSFAHWLNWKCGIGNMAAREKIRVARALPVLPLIDSAFRLGEISYSKARAMTRVATPKNEPLLMQVALYGTAQHVENVVQKYRRCQRLDLPEDALQREPSMTSYQDEYGMVKIIITLPTEEAELVLQATEKMIRQMDQDVSAGTDVSAQNAGNVSAETNVSAHGVFNVSAQDAGNVSAETSVLAEPENVSAETEQPMPLEAPAPSFSRDRAVALSRIVENYLAERHEQDEDEPRTLPGADRYHVVVHVNANEAHRDHQINGGPSCHLDDNRFLAPHVARRLACDAQITTVAEGDDGSILNIGRRSRTVPRAIKLTLKIRDGGCRFPGCHQKRWTDAHHIQHWSDGGETSEQNLVTLCRYHHQLVHQGDFTIEKKGGDILFINSQQNPFTGSLYPQFPGEHNPDRIIGQVRLQQTMRGIEIGDTTAVTRWRGETIDYGLAVTGLIQRDG